MTERHKVSSPTDLLNTNLQFVKNTIKQTQWNAACLRFLVIRKTTWDNASLTASGTPVSRTKFRHQHHWKQGWSPTKEEKSLSEFMFLLHKHIHTLTHSPVSLSRTLLIIWIAFLFRASGFTKPSPTGIHKSRKIAVRVDHHDRPKRCPCFPQIFTFLSVEQFFLYLLSSEYNEKFTESFLLKGSFVAPP